MTPEQVALLRKHIEDAGPGNEIYPGDLSDALDHIEEMARQLAEAQEEARFWREIDLARPSVQEPMEYVWRGGDPKPHDPEWARCQKWMADDPKGFGTQLAGVQKLHQQTIQQALARDEVREKQARRIAELEQENSLLKEQVQTHAGLAKDAGTERITELIDRLLEEDRMQREERATK